MELHYTSMKGLSNCHALSDMAQFTGKIIPSNNAALFVFPALISRIDQPAFGCIEPTISKFDEILVERTIDNGSWFDLNGK